jgi:hypothetical protein
MGGFCAATGYTPQQFWEITNEEFSAISRALRRNNG